MPDTYIRHHWFSSQGDAAPLIAIIKGRAGLHDLAGVNFADPGQVQYVREGYKNCELMDANFDGANLEDASFAGVGAYNARFTGTNCKGTDFSRCFLERALFGGSDLTGANFTASRMGWANLDGADVTGAVFDEAEVPGLGLYETRGKEILSPLVHAQTK